MDQNHSPKLNNLRQFIRSDQFLKKLTKFLLSVSVFSIFFSHSTFKYTHFSSLPLKLFTHTIDKNFMFLFCNGLLVFLAKYSRPRSPPPKNSLSHDYMKSYEDVHDQSIRMQSELPLMKEEMVEENGKTMEEGESKILVEVERETVTAEEEEEEEEVKNDETLIIEKEKEEEEEEENDVLILEEEVEELGEGSVALLTTEELNKKFDEFIRKMKEELRIEARQQLIMV